MKLSNFEEKVEEKILSRGLSYFENDYIEDIEKVDENEYCGTALGTDEYNVFIKIDHDQNIIEHSCDCPYDWGNICKHEVAMLYYLRGITNKGDEIQTGKIQIIKNELENLSKKELIDMVIDLSKRSKIIKQEIYWELDIE